jgi:antitoxin CcdA
MSVKASCNTTINKDLLNEAKALNIKLSPIFESALSIAVREEKKKKWFKENQQAIQQHNKQVTESGTFSESIDQLK